MRVAFAEDFYGIGQILRRDLEIGRVHDDHIWSDLDGVGFEDVEVDIIRQVLKSGINVQGVDLFGGLDF